MRAFRAKTRQRKKLLILVTPKSVREHPDMSSYRYVGEWENNDNPFRVKRVHSSTSTRLTNDHQKIYFPQQRPNEVRGVKQPPPYLSASILSCDFSLG